MSSYTGVPMIVNRAEVVSGGIFKLKWEPPLEVACPVVGYKVYYREVILPALKIQWNWDTVDGNATSYTMHLKCQKEYEVALSSLTTQGEIDFKDSDVWKFKTKGGNSKTIRLQFSANWQKNLFFTTCIGIEKV